ncbi:hypothetical protein SprV_0100404100 [Sparganum proliferum]
MPATSIATVIVFGDDDDEEEEEDDDVDGPADAETPTLARAHNPLPPPSHPTSLSVSALEQPRGVSYAPDGLRLTDSHGFYGRKLSQTGGFEEAIIYVLLTVDAGTRSTNPPDMLKTIRKKKEKEEKEEEEEEDDDDDDDDERW